MMRRFVVISDCLPDYESDSNEHSILLHVANDRETVDVRQRFSKTSRNEQRHEPRVDRSQALIPLLRQATDRKGSTSYEFDATPSQLQQLKPSLYPSRPPMIKTSSLPS